MDLKIVEKNSKNSRVTFSSRGQVRLKIGENQRERQNEVVELVTAIKENIGGFDTTLRTNIYTDRHGEIRIRMFL